VLSLPVGSLAHRRATRSEQEALAELQRRHPETISRARTNRPAVAGTTTNGKGNNMQLRKKPVVIEAVQFQQPTSVAGRRNG
jgi:hypothetical protein